MSDATTIRRYRPGPWRAIRRGVSLAWDNAGLGAALNLTWMAVLSIYSAAISGGWHFSPHPGSVPSHLPTGQVVGVPAVLGGIVLAGALAAGPAAAIARRNRLESADFMDCVRGIRRDGLRYALLALFGAAVLVECLFYNSWLVDFPSLWLLRPLPLYLAGFWMLAAPYQFALVSLEDRSIPEAIKRSGLLVLDNPLYTLLTGLLASLVLGVLVVSGIGMALALVPTWAALAQSATLEALRKYHPAPDNDTNYDTDADGAVGQDSESHDSHSYDFIPDVSSLQ